MFVKDIELCEVCFDISMPGSFMASVDDKLVCYSCLKKMRSFGLVAVRE